MRGTSYEFLLTFSQHYGKLPEEPSSFPYPIIADPKRELAVQLGMVDPVEKDKAGLPLTCRAVSGGRGVQLPSVLCVCV